MVGEYRGECVCVLSPEPNLVKTIWQSENAIVYPTLTQDAECDVCVVGGGVSGLSVALGFAERGLSVIVLEASCIGAGQTARSTAHLCTALDERYFRLERSHSQEIAKAAADCHGRAIEWIERVVARHEIDCGLRRVDGVLVVNAERLKDAKELLTKEHDSAGRAGVRSEWLAAGDSRLAGFAGGGLLFPNQAELHPLKYLDGLARSCQQLGARVCCAASVLAVDDTISRATVTLASGVKVSAKAVVLATHTLTPPIAKLLRPMTASVSFVVAFEATAPTSLLWDGYWDDDDTPYHFVRSAPGAEVGHPDVPHVLLVGGEDEDGERPRDELASYRKVERWAREHYPSIGKQLNAWWGRIAEPEGEFAIIGRVPTCERLYVVVGDSGNGVTYAAFAAQRLGALVMNEPTLAVEDGMFATERGEGQSSNAAKQQSSKAAK